LNWSIYDLKRFYDKVNIPKDDSWCSQWVWTGFVRNSSHGTFGTEYTQLAHRLNYHQVFGKMIPGIIIRHIGDVNPSDVNFFCLLTGNTKDNMNDKIESGYTPFGEGSGKAKLTNSQTYQIIRILYESADITQTELAEICGVTSAVINYISKNKTYKNVMKQFSEDRNITVKEVTNIIETNVSKTGKKRNSEVNSGSNHHSSKLNEEVIIKSICDSFICNHFPAYIYQNRIIGKYNILAKSFQSAILGTSWKTLDSYREAAKEMKVLKYSSLTTTYSDLINFMRNSPKYKDSYYLDQIKL